MMVAARKHGQNQICCTRIWTRDASCVFSFRQNIDRKMKIFRKFHNLNSQSQSSIDFQKRQSDWNWQMGLCNYLGSPKLVIFLEKKNYENSPKKLQFSANHFALRNLRSRTNWFHSMKSGENIKLQSKIELEIMADQKKNLWVVPPTCPSMIQIRAGEWNRV